MLVQGCFSLSRAEHAVTALGPQMQTSRMPHLDELRVGLRGEDRVRLELRPDAVDVQLIDLQGSSER